jgi:hypothetical protein
MSDAMPPDGVQARVAQEDLHAAPGSGIALEHGLDILPKGGEHRINLPLNP